MTSLRLVLVALATTHLGCLSAYAYRERPRIEARLDESSPPPKATIADEERGLVKEARLASIVRIALAKSPDVAEARSRARAALDRASAAGHLPDLEVAYTLWGAPLTMPWSLDKAQAHMLGVRQAFPVAGALDAKVRAGVEEARILLEVQRSRELDLVQQVQRTYFEYFRAMRELEIHEEHLGLVSGTVELVRVSYASAKGAQTDVLRATLETTRVHSEMIGLEADRDSSRARLNVLMGRAPDAALGPPVLAEPKAMALHLADLEKSLRARRPEVVAAEHAVKKSEAAVDGAKASAKWPTFMVGFDYMFMPLDEHKHGYSVMVSMSVPWLNPRHAEEVRAAEHEVAADKQALESLSRAASLQVRDAAARYEAARKMLAIVDERMLPEAKRSFDAEKVAYAAGGGSALSLLDAQRTLLTLRIDRNRAVARLASSVADLERVVGIELAKTDGSKP